MEYIRTLYPGNLSGWHVVINQSLIHNLKDENKDEIEIPKVNNLFVIVEPKCGGLSLTSLSCKIEEWSHGQKLLLEQKFIESIHVN